MDAMAAFVHRAFLFAIDAVTVMAEALDAFAPSGFAVVAGENHHGVVGEFLVIEPF